MFLVYEARESNTFPLPYKKAIKSFPTFEKAKEFLFAYSNTFVGGREVIDNGNGIKIHTVWEYGNGNADWETITLTVGLWNEL